MRKTSNTGLFLKPLNSSKESKALRKIADVQDLSFDLNFDCEPGPDLLKLFAPHPQPFVMDFQSDDGEYVKYEAREVGEPKPGTDEEGCLTMNLSLEVLDVIERGNKFDRQGSD